MIYATITALHWWAQFLHPGQLRDQGGYWFWSGIGSCLTYVAALGWVAAWWKHHNCHVKGCRRVGHLDPAVQAPACHRHHTARDLRGTDPHAAEEIVVSSSHA